MSGGRTGVILPLEKLVSSAGSSVGCLTTESTEDTEGESTKKPPNYASLRGGAGMMLAAKF